MKLSWLGIVLAAGAGLAYSQAGMTTRPEFAVASIKPNKTGCCVTAGVGNGGGGGRDVTLKMLIGIAWRVQEFQISGGARWIGTDRFDVEGKAEDPKADFSQLRLMLQSLLADRFKLKLHRETRVSPIYALVVGKGGPRIKPSLDQVSPDVNGPALPGAGPNHGVLRLGAGNMVGNAVTLSLFANFLSQRVDRLIVDKTKLAGRFDVQLRWAPDLEESPLDPGGNRLPSAIIDMKGATIESDPTGPSIFSALQEQLGLRLESAKGPVEVLVIDHVEQPSGN